MTGREAHELLERSRTELKAARSLVGGGFAAQAITHAYYATFFAAEAALLALGETRSKHSGVISAFGELVVKSGGVDRRTGAILRQLFELRNDAVYDAERVENDVALSAIAAADQFVTAVGGWLKERSAN